MAELEPILELLAGLALVCVGAMVLRAAYILYRVNMGTRDTYGLWGRIEHEDREKQLRDRLSNQ